LTVAAVMSLVLLGFVEGAAAFVHNALANGGFEKPVAGVARSCGAVPTAFGNWRGYTESPAAGQGPSIITSGSNHYARWNGVAGTHCVGGGWYQDVTFQSGGGYQLGAEVFPGSGSQEVAFIEGWTHGGTGTTLSADYVLFQPTGVVFKMWGKSATARAVTYDRWHKIVIFADGTHHSGQLAIDGVQVASIAGGTAPAGSATTGTVYLGHGNGADTSTSNFAFDSAGFMAVP
jgi:hypothetical protein